MRSQNYITIDSVYMNTDTHNVKIGDTYEKLVFRTSKLTLQLVGYLKNTYREEIFRIRTYQLEIQFGWALVLYKVIHALGIRRNSLSVFVLIGFSFHVSIYDNRINIYLDAIFYSRSWTLTWFEELDFDPARGIELQILTRGSHKFQTSTHNINRHSSTLNHYPKHTRFDYVPNLIERMSHASC